MAEPNQFKKEFENRCYKFGLKIINTIEKLKKDYINFFLHALKSANETKYWICLLRDSNKASSELADELLKEVSELANILAKSVLTMRGK